MDSRRGSAVSPAFGVGSRSSQGGSGADVYNGGGPGMGHVTASSNLSFGMTIVDTSTEQVASIVFLEEKGNED